MERIKVLELFAGIGACSKALTNLGIDHEIVDAVEIDKYAVASFNAIHGTAFEPQDITTWDKDIEVDLIMHGSPCQDFSIAGKGQGGDMDSGTRSSLMYETLRIVEKLKPKYVIWENVKNLLSKRHIHNFEAYLKKMEELGYTNHYQVLNAKNFGVPQNRERVFTMSIRNDIYSGFVFPTPQPLTKTLKDVLEDKVEEKYYLSDEQVASFTASTERAKSKGNGFKFEPTEGEKVAHTVATRAGSRQTDNFIKVVGKLGIKGNDQLKRVYDTGGVSPTLSTMQGGNTEPKIIASRGCGMNNEQHLEPRKDGLTNTITSVQKDNYVAIKTANKQGYDLATDGDGVDLSYPSSKTRRGRVGHGVSKTIPAADCQGVVEYSEESLKRIKQNIIKSDVANTITANAMQSFNHNNCALFNNGFRIRRLTPKECWRLMGFDDEDFEKAAKVNSNTQLYKQAGNSIVVNVLEALLTNLLKEEHGR